MNINSSPSSQGLGDKGIGFWEVLYQVLVGDIIYLNQVMYVFREFFWCLNAQNCNDMRDVCLLEGVGLVDGMEPACYPLFSLCPKERRVN